MEKLVEQLATCNAETDTLAVTLEAFKERLISKEDLKDFTSITPEVSIVERRRTLLQHVQTRSEEKLHELAKYGSNFEVRASAVQALREGFIKDDVCKHLDSLHSEVPSSMRCRYLLQSVHQSLKKKIGGIKKRALVVVPYKCFTDQAIDHLKFAKNAEKDGLIEKCVLDHLVSLYPFEFQPISNEVRKMLEHSVQEKEFRLNDLAKENISLSNPSNIVSGATDLLIALEQLPILYELLVKHAFKWESIGIALNFQSEDLKNIQASPLLMPNAPQSYLYKLLEKWLRKEFKYILPPSVACLKRALNSQTVGLGLLVAEIDKNFSRSYSQSALNPSYCLINVESPFPKSNAVYVKEEESTLLEIQVPQCEAYQWMKDGAKLSPQNSSTGPIFCLYQADIDWDGCEISCQTRPFAKTEAPIITVQVSSELDVYRTHLASMYLAQPEVPEDTWPPVGNLKYVNLALIKQGVMVNYSSEYARLTIRGDLDDVLQDKQIIAYDDIDIYSNLKGSKLVLIEGRPGSGKTTFVHKLAQDWALKSGGSVRLLLLVSLRVLNTFSNPDLSDILKLFKDLKVTKKIIEKRSGKGVCFIFDGFDEFLPQNGQSSIVHEIIEKTYLHHSIVIVASRPAAIAKLRHRAEVVFEVVGFLNEQIIEYIDCYPFKTSTKSAELKSYLELHPNIFHMCYLPIHATMVAFLFEVLGKVPRTETEIYTHFTRQTLIRNLTKNCEFEPVDVKLDSLTGDEGICFKQICLLAFEKILSSKQILEQNEVESHFQTKRRIDSSLGLITVDRTAGLYGYKNIYTFMHLTFQEYLAAYHITTLSDEEQMKLIEAHGDKNHMLVVWKFYCGLMATRSDQTFKSILKKSAGNTLFHIQCGYETQHKITCELVLKSVNYHIKLEDKYLSTPEFTALGYVTNTSFIPTELSLLNCNMNVEATDALLSEVEGRARDSIQGLHIVTATFDDSKMECLKKLLVSFKSLEVLFLKVEVRTRLSNFTEVSSVTLSNLSELSLIDVDITPLLSDYSFASLSSLCVKGGNLDVKYLFLTSTSLQSLEVSLNIKQFDIFCKCAQKWKNLQELNVSFEQSELLHSSDSKMRFQFLRYTQALSIKNTGRCENALPQCLAVGLQWFPNMQDLDLSKNRTTADSIKEMYVILCKFLCLTELRMDSSHIGDRKVKTLSLMLRYISRLRKLSLSNNSISSRGCFELAANLHHCSNLETLSLRNNRIAEAGVSAIMFSLISCRRFQELNLLENRWCNIQGDKAITFSVLLSCNGLCVMSFMS